MNAPLPEYVSAAQLRKMGFGPTGVAHLKRACGVTKIGHRYYVRRADLERVLAERKVRAS